ncbi:probable cytochrome P450 6a13 [Fopius arisanus]|uniref:Probable cytochrome P450 6a13 n=1 Tax=Fopius arisanus TaxID=64838 RepID=A0A9R1TAI2_9HYME|nr:PREDICTED: probable cytochrome P450 6a13 [Fopius arisanus]
MDFVVEMLIAPLVLILMLFDFFNSKWECWFRLNIEGPEPNIICGNIGSVALGRISFVEMVNKFYREWRAEPYFGIFVWRTPVLIINDLNVVKYILLDNAKLFATPKLVIGRGIIHQNSYKSCGTIDHSKVLETVLTSEKVRDMFDLVIRSTNGRQETLNKIIKGKGVVDCSQFAEYFTTEILIHCVFGVDGNSPMESEKIRTIIRGLCGPRERYLYPRKLCVILRVICCHLGVKENAKKWEFFVNLIREKIKHREERNIVCPDFIGVLQDLKSRTHGDNLEWTDDCFLASEAIAFLITSYNSSVLLITAVLYELSINQEVEKRLRTEIRETLKFYNESNCNVLDRMEYISMVLAETLRKHPLRPLLKRKLNENIQIEKSQMKMPRNTRIIIPVSSIHHDEKYYPEPNTFSPERFSIEEINRRNSMTFLPYDGGATSSLGERVGIRITKLALIFLLKSFRLNPTKINYHSYLKFQKVPVDLIPSE